MGLQSQHLKGQAGGAPGPRQGGKPACGPDPVAGLLNSESQNSQREGDSVPPPRHFFPKQKNSNDQRKSFVGDFLPFHSYH